MGRAAYERVRAEHLPMHRAQRILEFAADAADRRARGAQADKWTALTCAYLWEAGRSALLAGEVLNRLAAVNQDGDVTTAAIHVQAMAGEKRLVDDNLASILGGQLYADNPGLNLTGSMAALKGGPFRRGQGVPVPALPGNGQARCARPARPGGAALLLGQGPAPGRSDHARRLRL